jgi:hypothetical protein
MAFSYDQVLDIVSFRGFIVCSVAVLAVAKAEVSEFRRGCPPKTLEENGVWSLIVRTPDPFSSDLLEVPVLEVYNLV